ncbi:hypothetical protein MYP_670 [Sporocytophaga myxococcoides]|uniref:Uncharacterized protein n=1 Tax=Sporocytophaga myxococcoides TaxID=153721 RepID=A0A098LB84_9BACT|nr:hypothetical protein [Sporocytophaga myxococcoides]GAL83443.1 hypothetical protein MYP_670 [Sporocytophaga myxococcoides]
MSKAIDKITKGTHVKRFLEDRFKTKIEVRSEQTVGKGTMVIVKPGFSGGFEDSFLTIVKNVCPEFEKTIKKESIRLNLPAWRYALQAVFDNNIATIFTGMKEDKKSEDKKTPEIEPVPAPPEKKENKDTIELSRRVQNQMVSVLEMEMDMKWMK